MTVQVFNPEKSWFEKKDGTLLKRIYRHHHEGEVAQNSLVMQLGKYHEMDGQQEKQFMSKLTEFLLTG